MISFSLTHDQEKNLWILTITTDNSTFTVEMNHKQFQELVSIIYGNEQTQHTTICSEKGKENDCQSTSTSNP